ncbi:MAG: NAD(P)H-dependent glycerol-3-phosphate dehydrogenase [Beijerinckiaceae bacterium]
MGSGPRIAVIGAGAWGTALANLAARNAAKVVLVARDAAHAAEMTATGVNARRLPGVPLASNVQPTADLARAATAEVVLLAVPTQALRNLCERLAPLISPEASLTICAKGIEQSSRLFVSEVVGEILPENPLAVLSGPSFATDVARGLPTAVTLAAAEAERARALAQVLATPWFRLYHSTDIRGVEIGGAAKNVLAIANGIAAGRGLGASAGAALVARGFAELSRFGRAFGAHAETLMGLSGLGDLVLTCTSPQSRNFSLGLALGRGASLASFLAEGRLAEGIYTCGVLVDLAAKKGIEMPIAAAVDAVLAERIEIAAAIEALLSRPPKAETADAAEAGEI